MRKWLDLRLFILLIGCTVFILGFSQLGSLGYQAVFQQDHFTFSEETKIGPISINGMTRTQAEEMLNNKIKNWSSSSAFFLQHENMIKELPTSIFQIDYKNTLSQMVDGEQTELMVSINDALVQETIRNMVNQAIYEDINIAKLSEDLIRTAQLLEPKSNYFQLIEYVKNDAIGEPRELSNATIRVTKTQQEQLQRLLDNIGEQMVVEPYQSYSLLNVVDQNSVLSDNSEALNMLATGLYQVVLPTNFSIVERNISNHLPIYSEKGLEAKVSTNMDLIFHNPNPYPYTITFKVNEDGLFVKLIGTPFPYKYEIRVEEETFPPKTIVQYSALLGPNESKIVEQGENARLIKVFRDTKDDNGITIESTSISEDFYPPVHRIQLFGLSNPQTNNQRKSDELNESDENDTANQNDTEIQPTNDLEDNQNHSSNDIKEDKMEQEDLI